MQPGPFAYRASNHPTIKSVASISAVGKVRLTFTHTSKSPHLDLAAQLRRDAPEIHAALAMPTPTASRPAPKDVAATPRQRDRAKINVHIEAADPAARNHREPMALQVRDRRCLITPMGRRPLPVAWIEPHRHAFGHCQTTPMPAPR